MQHETTLIKSGLRYAVTNNIYPPKYSIVELIGDNGGYTHIQLWNNKRGATAEIIDNGGILCEYKEPAPAASTSKMPEALKKEIRDAYEKDGGYARALTIADASGLCEWEYCKGCDNEMPVIKFEHECLICGHQTWQTVYDEEFERNRTTKDGGKTWEWEAESKEEGTKWNVLNSESKEGYTKGDWEVDFDLSGDYYQLMNGETVIANIFNQNSPYGISKQEAEANAQLIASAPTLKKERDSLLSVLGKLIEVATRTTKDIVAFEGADELDTTIDEAKALLSTINK